MISFSRPQGPGNWRYSMSYRARKSGPRASWIVERWGGSEWVYVGGGETYAAAREVATEHRDMLVRS